MSLQGWQRQFAAFGCSRSAVTLLRSVISTRERPLSPSLTFSTASANVKSQDRRAIGSEYRHGLLRVGLSRSRTIQADVRVPDRSGDTAGGGGSIPTRPHQRASRALISARQSRRGPWSVG